MSFLRYFRPDCVQLSPPSASLSGVLAASHRMVLVIVAAPSSDMAPVIAASLAGLRSIRKY
jgi:hypothetical protein